jgi:hypothetical protein
MLPPLVSGECDSASPTIAKRGLWLYDAFVFPITLIHQRAGQLGLEFLVIGGHAVNAYCEPRATLDVDFLVCRDQRSGWSDVPIERGYRELPPSGSWEAGYRLGLEARQQAKGRPAIRERRHAPGVTVEFVM